LNIDKDFKHYDPYELWIDAGYFDAQLNELTKDTPETSKLLGDHIK
jgi:hypothetical protein